MSSPGRLRLFWLWHTPNGNAGFLQASILALSQRRKPSPSYVKSSDSTLGCGQRNLRQQRPMLHGTRNASWIASYPATKTGSRSAGQPAIWKLWRNEGGLPVLPITWKRSASAWFLCSRIEIRKPQVDYCRAPNKPDQRAGRVKQAKYPGGLKGRENLGLDSAERRAELSRPYRPLGFIMFPNPRASAFGLSPGLCSAGPLGRF